jgi:predicted metalloprotease with PDZ domain
VHVRPEAWIGVRHSAPAPTGELWWAEGVTFYYADLIQRRAVLHVEDSTRTAHLARLIEAWLANPSDRYVSPEAASRGFNQPMGAYGDYTPSFYLQGELLGNVLDLTIRAHTNGKRSLDDAMRAMTRRFSMERGYTGADVQGAVEDACGCNLRAFFDAHVRGTDSLDVNGLLAPAGLRVAVEWKPALGGDGRPAPDLRIQAGQSAAAPGVLLNVLSPVTPLARAGYHTRDRVVSVNGTSIADVATFRRLVGALHIGDTLRVVVARGACTKERALENSG